MAPRPSAGVVTFALEAVAAINAANAWRPVDRHGPASVAAFSAAWPTSELPLAALGAHALTVAVGARRGGFGGRLGIANAALAGASAGGFVALQAVARSSSRVYDEALFAGLGAGYHERVAHPRRPDPDGAVARTPGVVRMARIRRRFAHDADVAYSDGGAPHHLDIWRREDLPAGAGAPVLLQIPGGAWTTGNKQGQAYPLMSHLAERGWVCVSIDYRLAPRHAWPAQIVDVKRAIAWVRAHIGEYGGDPGFVAVTGGSAGGHLCSLAALTPGETRWQPGFENADTSVAAAVPFYGAYDWTDRSGIGHRQLLPHLEKSVVQTPLADSFDTFDAASPMSRVTAAAPPFLVSHGVNDSLIPVEQARAFVARLRERSRSPVVYAELPRAQHAFDVLGTPRAIAAAEAVEKFLGVVYRGHLDTRDALDGNTTDRC